MEYIEVAIGGPKNRNKIIPAQNVPMLYGKQQTFRSYYTFDSERLTHAQSGGTSRTFEGPLYCGFGHVWDLDFEGRIDDAMSNALMLVEKLQYFGVPEHMIRIYFSGKKGFHIAIPDLFGFESGPYIYATVQQTMMDFWPDADPSIYRRTGLIRVNNTEHGYTGRYKVPITKKDLQEPTADKILSFSNNYQLAMERVAHKPVRPEEVVLCLSEMIVEQELRPVEASAYKDNAQEKVPDYLTCMWHLERDGAESGLRHETALRLAASYHHRAIPKDTALHMLVSWAESVSTDADVYSAKDATSAVEWAYGRDTQTKFRCADEIMQSKCDPHCRLYKNLEGKPSQTMEDIARQYMHELSEKRTSFKLDEVGWKGIGYTFQAREIALIVGDTKLGKSSLVWNWMTNLSKFKIYYISPELGPGHIFQKLAQIKYGVRMKLDDDVDEMSKIVEDGGLIEMARNLEYITIDTDSPSLEKLEKILKDEKPDMLVLDPYECLYSERDKDMREDKIADQFRSLVNKSGVIAICIQHINKDGQKQNRGGVQIELYMIKGMKRIQEQSDHIIAFEGREGTSYRKVRRLRGRNPQDLDTGLKGDLYTHRFYVHNKEVISDAYTESKAETRRNEETDYG